MALTWKGVLAPLDTYDARKRRIPSSIVTNTRQLPLPFSYQPADWGNHAGAVDVGRIERIWVEGNQLWGEGSFDAEDEQAVKVFSKIARGYVRHISVDLEPVSLALMGATIVSKPSFGAAEVKHVSSSETVSSTPMTFSVQYTQYSEESTETDFPQHVTWDEASDESGNRVENSNNERVAQALRWIKVSSARYEVETFSSDFHEFAWVDDLLASGSVTDDLVTFNWVEDVGGLPTYIKRISKHLRRKGMTESRAIATAVNVAKKMCATGDLNWPGLQRVNPGSRAAACAAVASWFAKRARARAT